jgi:hypothetical protein
LVGSVLVVAALLTLLRGNHSFSAIECPSSVEAGAIGKGEYRELNIPIRNRSETPLNVSHVKTSCPCLEVDKLPWLLASGEEMSVPVALNLVNEPAFSGDLIITLTGGTEATPQMFQTQIRATVVEK